MANRRYTDVERFAWILYAAGSQILDYSGFYALAIRLLRQAAEAAEKQGDRQAQGVHLGSLGTAYAGLGQYERAIEHHQQALAISREIGDRRNEGNWLGNLGIAYADLGQYERAIEHYQQARAIFEAIGVPHLVKRIDANIAKARAKLAGDGEAT